MTMRTSRPILIAVCAATALLATASIASAAAAAPDPRAAIYANLALDSAGRDDGIIFFDGLDGAHALNVGAGSQASTTDLAVSPDGRILYAAVSGSTDFNGPQPHLSLVPITLATGAVGSPIATVPGGDARVALSRDGSTAYLYGDDVIYPITLATGHVGSPFTLGPIYRLTVSPDGTRLYATIGNDFVALDARTGGVVHQLALGQRGEAIRLTSDGRTAYVTAVDGSTPGALVKIDLSTFAITDQVALPVSSDLGLALSPDQALLYVTGTTRDKFFAIPVRTSDLHLGTELDLDATTPADAFVDAAFSADGKTLFTYVVARVTAQAVVIDVASNSITAAPDLAHAFTTAFDPDGVTTPPDQAPIARFTARAKCAGLATAFDASRSTVAAGRIVSYRWDFGDGTTRTTTGPKVNHTYAAPGRYPATVTETDSVGTSTTVVFDGQQVLRNGGPSARAQHTVTVAACAAPANTPAATPDGTDAVAASDTPTLPKTGTDAPGQLAMAMSLVAIGLGLRRFSRRRAMTERDF
jgi:PKD domain